MSYINKSVFNKTHGNGIIISDDESQSVIEVRFDDGYVSSYKYPACFNSNILRINEVVTTSSDKPIHIGEAACMKCYSVKSFVDSYNEALNSEINFLKESGEKPQKISDGKKVDYRDGKYIYSFEAETELYFPDDLPIILSVSNEKYDAVIENCDEFTILISVKEDIGTDILEAEFTSDAWKLLENLIESVNAMSDKHSNLLEKLVTEEYESLVEDNQDIVTGQANATKMSTEQPITFIWGPPGTGKTQTLANIAIEHIKRGNRVLMVSYSNVSVDGAILRVNKLMSDCKPGTLIRYGYPRVKELLESDTLTGYSYVVKMYPELLAQRNALQEEKKGLSRSSKRYLDIVSQLSEINDKFSIEQTKAVYAASFVATTITKAILSDVISKSHFDVVIFDEASMAYIPQIIVASNWAQKHFICMGDFRQLPPIVQSDRESILNADIFQYCGISRAINEGKKHKWLCMLDTQYRMHPQIAEYASSMMYNGLLKSGPTMAEDRAEIVNEFPYKGTAVGFADLSETMSVCTTTPDHSRINVLSAFVSLALAIKAAEKSDVGIITPYHSQSRLIYSMIRDLEESKFLSNKITSATVHQFQGSEKDVIFYDAVDSYRAKTISVLLMTKKNGLCDRLFNVALTRAKGKFVGVVNYSFLESRGYKNAYMFGRLMQTLKNTDNRLQGKALATELVATNTSAINVDDGNVLTAQFVEDIISAKKEIIIDIPGKVNSNCIEDISNALAYVNELGVKVIIRANQKSVLPHEFQKYAVENPTVFNPITVIDKKIIWFGEPVSEADIVLGSSVRPVNFHLVFRFVGKNTAKSLINFLEMNDTSDKYVEPIKEGSDSYVSFSDYIKQKVPCPSCGIKSATISKSNKYNSYYIGFKCWRKCGYQSVKTISIVNDYLSSENKKCPSCGEPLVAKFRGKSTSIACANNHEFTMKDI